MALGERILAYRSGFPFTVGQGDDLNTGGFTPVRPDRIGDGRLSDPTRQLWFNPRAFQRVTCNIPSRPDLCHYGSAGVNILNGPGQKNADLSMFKNFRVAEGKSFQFRCEAFNAFNTVQFGQAIPGVSNGSFGMIFGTANTPRQMQLGLKFLF